MNIVQLNHRYHPAVITTPIDLIDDDNARDALRRIRVDKMLALYGPAAIDVAVDRVLSIATRRECDAFDQRTHPAVIADRVAGLHDGDEGNGFDFVRVG